jgi:hypothetical protein
VVPPGSSLIEIDLIEQPDGTLLRLTHTGLPNAEQCAGHAEGWAITSAGWPKLRPGASWARIPGTAALAGSDCLPRSISPHLSFLQFHGERRLAGMSTAASSRIGPYGRWGRGQDSRPMRRIIPVRRRVC